ncbi:MAG TPA: radical SAM family heme chaperone HemW [Roseiflexaceae bacterium]|nr:radical SAM family heme chaperone HemW [Roseiflexaceae bacterium]HMP40817.1 radical SAM family heme chaperone HemW [Roseiflexaceae bacterium]
MNPHHGVRHLYIHIPFCERRCSYCDFNTYANMEDRIGAYVAALGRELAAWQTRLGSPEPLPAPQPPALMRADLKPTVFLGGGTPSMLPLPLIEQVLNAADPIVPLRHAEVTVECNPGTLLGRDYLRGLRALGVNRISMGVQSLHDPTLRILGRSHTAAEARRSYEEARRAGFDSINLDFIFGLPGQTPAQWEAMLHELLAWQIDHFSLYSLILEETTPLYAQVTSGRMAVPDDDSTGEMYEQAIEILGGAGYRQYEISNWARTSPGDGVIPVRACHHNLAYWLNADYLGCGAGAHGHLYPQRYFDTLAIDDYIRKTHTDALPLAEITELTPADLAAETMFMGLRLNAGVSLPHFADRCGVAIDTIYGAVLADLEAQGLLERDSLAVRLSARGRMLGNRVFERFV